MPTNVQPLSGYCGGVEALQWTESACTPWHACRWGQRGQGRELSASARPLIGAPQTTAVITIIFITVIVIAGHTANICNLKNELSAAWHVLSSISCSHS